MMRARFFIFAASLFAALLFSNSAVADEVIKDYDVDMVVREDGSLSVTETITVLVEGYEIRRGIYRELPRYLEEDSGRTRKQEYNIQSITRNGKKEPYSQSRNDNALTVRIGDADVLLEHKEHTYELVYELPYMIRRRDDRDELYFNPIGAYWNFPIEAGTITVAFPSGADAIDVSTYVGKQNASSAQAQGGLTQRRGNDGAYIFDLERTLQPKEGVTLSLSVPKGVIAPPGEAEKRYFWWRNNGPGAVLGGLLALLAGFYALMWNKVGRDPMKKAVIPLYKPPAGLSPAGASYVYYRKVKGYQPLIASFLNMAIWDILKLETEKKTTVLTSLSDQTDKLHEEEVELFESVFGRAGKTVKLSKKPNRSFHSAVTKFHRNLGKKFGKDYYRGNAGAGCLGIVLIAVTAVWAIGFSEGRMPIWAWGILAALVVVTIVAGKLIAAPTELGQRVRTEIEGFRLYMNTAEKLQLNAHEVGGPPPPMTTERYELFLPYAIALGVEKPWSEYFEKVMPKEAANYQPRNTHGDFHTGSGVSNMTKALVAGVAAGVAAAAPASSSSSGSSGGGSVGGGGGGGGGGGW